MLCRLLVAACLFVSLTGFSGPGHRVVYDVTIDENVQANYQRLASGRPDTSKMPVSFSNLFENRYQFTLSLTLLSEESSYRLMQGNISVKTVSLKQDHQEDQRRMAAFQQSSAAPFYFKLTPTGMIYAIEMAPGTAASYANFLRDLLSQLQVVVPPQAGQSWQANQEYPDGIYRVQYEPAGSGHSFSRSIIGKQQDGGGVENGATDSVTASENIVLHSRENLLAAKLFFHKTFYQKLGTSILAYVDRTIQAETIREENDNEKWNEYMAAYRDASVRRIISNIYNPVSEERRKVLVSQGVLKKDTYETLVAQLSTVARMDNENLNLLVSKFRALLFLQPEHIPSILDRIEQAKADEPAFAILTAALIEVDTDSAQDALATLMEKHANDWQVLQRIIPALGLRKYLSARLEKILLRLRLQSDDDMIATSAGLALSNLCRNIAMQEPSRANDIMERLVTNYKNKPKDKTSISRFLNETGNAGFSATVEENEKYLSAEDIDIRMRAWYSLRLFKMASVDSLLNAGLLSDTTSAIQQRILTLIHMRPVTATYKEGVLHVLKNASNEQSRELAMIWLQKYVNAYPDELKPMQDWVKGLNNKSLEERFNKRPGQAP